MSVASFCLPDTSGERVSLLITNLLSLAFFLVIIASKIPPTSEVTPLLAVYLTSVFIEISLALVARAFIDKARRLHKKPGILISKVINKCLATILRTKSSNQASVDLAGETRQSGLELDIIAVNLSQDINLTPVPSRICSAEKPTGHQAITKRSEGKQRSSSYSEAKRRILSSLCIISSTVEEEENSETAQEHLDNFLFQLDEFLFWIFFLTLFISISFLFLVPPCVTL